MDDRNDVTIVTGGASGIGLATARALLAAEPATHVALVDLNQCNVDDMDAPQGAAPLVSL